MKQSRMPRRLRYSLTRLGQSYRGAGMRCHWPRMVLDWSGRQRLCSLSTCSAQAIPHRSRVYGHIDRDVIRNPGPSASARRWPRTIDIRHWMVARNPARVCALSYSVSDGCPRHTVRSSRRRWTQKSGERTTRRHGRRHGQTGMWFPPARGGLMCATARTASMLGFSFVDSAHCPFCIALSRS